MRKTLVWLGLAVVMLSLAAPVWAAEADRVGGEEEPLNIGRLVVIAEEVQKIDDIWCNRVKGYDPAKLAVGESIPVYYYTDNGFELEYFYYPVLFKDQLFMIVWEREGSFGFNDVMDRWLREAGAKVDCPLAIVWDYSNVYFYNGSRWQLLHRSGDIHMRMHDLPELDIENTSGEGLELRAMNQRLTPLADAYYGRLSLEQQAEVEEFRQEMAKAQEEAEVRALQELEQKMRAAGFVPIFVNGKLADYPGVVVENRVVIAPWEASEILRINAHEEDGCIILSNGEDSVSLRWQDGSVSKNGQPMGQLKLVRVDRNFYMDLDDHNVSVRDFAEFFGMQVRWDAANRQINIISK